MKTSSRVFIAVVVAFLLGSCSATGQSSTQMATNFINQQQVTATTKDVAPKNPQIVALYSKNKLPLSPYRVIGTATVSKYNLIGVERQDATLNQMMKKLAASIGGDGVIQVSNNNKDIQAKVIAFQQILL